MYDPWPTALGLSTLLSSCFCRRRSSSVVVDVAGSRSSIPSSMLDVRCSMGQWSMVNVTDLMVRWTLAWLESWMSPHSCCSSFSLSEGTLLTDCRSDWLAGWPSSEAGRQLLAPLMRLPLDPCCPSVLLPRCSACVCVLCGCECVAALRQAGNDARLSGRRRLPPLLSSPPPRAAPLTTRSPRLPLSSPLALVSGNGILCY